MRTAIADDDPIVCQSLATILTATHTADVLWTANDGDAAVTEYFRSPSSRPDVLLIDVQMPGKDGLAAAREILAKDPGAKILFLTTFADRSYITQAVSLGARGYLIKQDVASVGPALQAVMAGQIVLGAEVLDKLSGSESSSDMTDAADTAGAAGPTGTSAGITSAAGRECDHAADRDALEALPERDRDIAALVAEGLDNRDIAARLYLSEGTVRNRVSGILDKMGLTNRTQLAILWIRGHR
ncbi:response regulator transcription factor [Bifidobacterium amazonense]|uniref:Response regulator transcription factor n=1 Tax=Bifidobacterium amazonense TaxID=2809027 RepID=A0ABS9VT24_9BIFI|nr:response regulator transcription factor [Bifidobacterium amazonense]MCH9275230.1 response regulator transcription factor [Bifidobacterium amazonense]